MLRKEIENLEFSTGIIKQDLALSHNLDFLGYSKYINFQLKKKKNEVLLLYQLLGIVSETQMIIQVLYGINGN